MFAVLLLLTSTFATEASSTIGKQSVRRKRENVPELAFLAIFWGFIFMLVTLAFGAKFRFDPASLPTLIPRLVLETAFTYYLSRATVEADRSTAGFLRLITIPLVLVIDIALGYHISLIQIFGIALMFIALVIAFHGKHQNRKGASVAIISALLSAATISLYKYDITHYNSVAAEQIIVMAYLLVFFFLASVRAGRSPLRLLIKPATGGQSLSNGVAIVLESFAVSLIPASVMITLKRSFGIMWAIAFGGKIFHEKSLRRKLSSAAIRTVSLFLSAEPTILHK
jgi:drug/metabolite transporter (DMT)-like permease